MGIVDRMGGALRSGRRKKGNKCDQNVLYRCMCEFELIRKEKLKVREQIHISNLRYSFCRVKHIQNKTLKKIILR